uniref:Protein kinase domain-containing protein n=1 Tax=Moniliophthora roreri TaxID=221103 RepID=A0A0W0FHD5_MONRR
MSDSADTESLPRWTTYPPPPPIPFPTSSNTSASSAYLNRSASMNNARRLRQHSDLDMAPPNSFYSQSVAYNSPSIPQNSVSSPSSADPYTDISSRSRTGRSPAALLDPYSPQHSSQYSPTANPNYSFGPPPPPPPSSDQRPHPPPSSTYPGPPPPPPPSHSRSHSQVKNESMSPPVGSPYSPHQPLHPGSVYTPTNYAIDSTSPPSSHLTPHVPTIRKNSISQPPTPLSYMPSSSPYYSQDQNMIVDPPQRRRASGFRRVRDAHDIQPRLDVPHTGRRMGSDGKYLSPLQQLTVNIVDTYHICNPQFRYESAHNPRRVLTKPSKPAHNEGYDNEDYDYILYVNDWLGTEEGHKYLILDILGQGTFGQVVKCQNMKTHEVVAVKVVKNKPAYFNQSMMEVTILELLNKQCDPNDEHHILRLRDSFIHRNHLCLVFELLSSNLYELIKQNQFQGLSTQLVKVFMAQLLDALTVLKEARLIHCDLKPENILLKSLQSPQIKVIDFGSACHERQTVYTYIQSRFYRSPEVLLGLSYTAAIDVWSLGCIAVELFLGLPLFPGTSEYNQLTRIIEMLGYVYKASICVVD